VSGTRQTGPRRLRWLHLTDAHFGQPGHHLWSNVESAVFRDLAALQESPGPIDLVFFTGDAAFKGSAEEFSRFEQMRERLLAALTVRETAPLFFTVPGNHDLERPDELTGPAIAADSWPGAPNLQQDFWTNKGNLLRVGVDEALKNWKAWATGLRDDPRVTRYHDGLLPGDFVATVDLSGLLVGIVGLNTTFLQLKAGDFEGRLTVDYRQISDLWGDEGGDGWAQKHNATLLLTHHPDEWFDRAGLTNLQDELAPAGRFTARLCGHMHAQHDEISVVGGAKPRCTLLGRSLFGLDTWDANGQPEHRLHGYCVGELTLEDSGAKLRLWPRVGTKSRGGGWNVVRDPDADLQDEDGGTAPVTVSGSFRGPPAPVQVHGETESVAGDESLREAVASVLRGSTASRSPILIALEANAQPLTNLELSTTERHLTVTLNDDDLDAMAAVVHALEHAEDVDDIVRAGGDSWSILVDAQPRLEALVRSVAEVGLEQPVAWSGRAELIARLRVPLLLAHTGGEGAEGLLTVGAGAHYFMPVRAPDGVRSLPQRSGANQPATCLLDLQDFEGESREKQISDAAMGEVVIAVDPDAAAAGVAALVGRIRSAGQSPTRALFVFGGDDTRAETLNEFLDTVPFLAVADPALALPEVRDALEAAVSEHGSRVALPCVVAAVRTALVRDSFARGDADECRRSLAWTSWSWIGLPLFARTYGAVKRPVYPHLMDLRSVAAGGWYFNRRKGIPQPYAADSLARADVEPEERFHLYVSGAGGTGKSCFLRYVYDQCAARASTVAVWYRVDAPSSQWENVERRVREETIAVLHNRLGDDATALVPDTIQRLGPFLREASKRLRSSPTGIDEIVVFIDQLERTFESGDEPDPERLETISFEFVQLLRTVEVGQGVRIFVASRKQYLPDFLGSSYTANECGLHFNVLQTITDSTERVEFVNRVVGWCRENQLVDASLSIPSNVAKSLVEHVDGHPLNAMLALIQLLSQNLRGALSDDDLGGHRSWERLFALDLEAAAREDLDWHFLLAMAGARTEIVRFDEVWWRLRMVDPRLTRRADELQRQGILERLWLLGFLGRTIHARPQGDDPAGFVEFFHANLRDYLLRDVMARTGSDLDLQGRRGGVPSAWRALERLSVYAHDWEQMQQQLPDDDIHALMEHREVVVERPAVRDDPDALPFHLLFLRDPVTSRDRLSRAAMECFVYSALVHDDRGRWAFDALFPDVDERVACCRRWLERCPASTRPPVLRYLVEQIVLQESLAAVKLLAEIVLDRRGHDADDMTTDIADLLAEPLHAARYRTEVVAALLDEAFSRVGGDVQLIAARVPSFVASACAGDRDTLVRVLGDCAARLRLSQQPEARAGAEQLTGGELVDGWLLSLGAGGGRRAATVRPLAARASVLQVVAGDRLAEALTSDRVAQWSGSLSERLGIPLPELEIVGGEAEEDELEFRIHGERVSSTPLEIDRVCVVQRQWYAFDSSLPTDARETYDSGIQEDVVWAPPDAVNGRGYPFPVWDVDAVAVNWLEAHCRQNVQSFLDTQLVIDLLAEVWTAGSRRTSQHRVSLRTLQQVLTELVGEGVPLDGRREAVLDEFLNLARRFKEPDALVQRLREHLRVDICRSIVDESGQVVTLLLDEGLEGTLADRVLFAHGRSVLAVDPRQAIAVAAAVRRRAQQLLRSDPRLVPVLVTVPSLRPNLSRLLRRFDQRIRVLSFTELDPDVIEVRGGLVSVPELQQAAA
jgi:hypothetical protein